MQKVAEKVTRFNCRLPNAIADWLGERAKGHGVTLSEEVRHILMEVKTGEELIERVGSKK